MLRLKFVCYLMLCLLPVTLTACILGFGEADTPFGKLKDVKIEIGTKDAVDLVGIIKYLFGDEKTEAVDKLCAFLAHLKDISETYQSAADNVSPQMPNSAQLKTSFQKVADDVSNFRDTVKKAAADENIECE